MRENNAEELLGDPDAWRFYFDVGYTLRMAVAEELSYGN